MKVTDKYVFFWGGPFSNFAPIKEGIKFDGFRFPTSEHVFMYIKAKTFNDNEIAEQIKSAPDPKTAKKLGRKVRGFNEEVWKKHRDNAMKTAVQLKFDASSEFRNELLKEKYKNKTFVEASPYDCVWGIGMSMEDPNVNNEHEWRGLNLLGNILTKLRDENI